jgi:hypothetical protein
MTDAVFRDSILSDTQVVLPVPDEPKVINWKSWAMRVVFVALGILLGLWLSMPVSTIFVENIYQVQPGDSLERVAEQLEIDADELIAMNRATYPLINDGRLQEGWKLIYLENGLVPRWRSIIDKIAGWFEGTGLGRGLQNDLTRIENEQYKNPLGGIDSNKTAIGHAKYMVDLINYLRSRQGLDDLREDDQLMILAQSRAAVCLGIYNEPLSNYPLCDGCVEIRSNRHGKVAVDPAEYYATGWTTAYPNILFGDYEYIGIGTLYSPKGDYSACSVAIFK